MAHKYRWNISEFENIRRRPQVVALLGKSVERIRAAAGASGPGEGYTASVVQGKTRARATVAAYSAYARNDNAEDNSLLKALDAGRIL